MLDHYLEKKRRTLPCARCGQLGHWKDDNDCPAKVKVVNWEESEEQVTEELHPFPVTTHGRSILHAPSPWLELVGFRGLKLS